MGLILARVHQLTEFLETKTSYKIHLISWSLIGQWSQYKKEKKMKKSSQSLKLVCYKIKCQNKTEKPFNGKRLPNFENCLTTAWCLPDDCLTITQPLPEYFPMTEVLHLMTSRQIPNDCPTTARRLPDDCLTTAQQLPNNCSMSAWQLPYDCPTTAWWLPGAITNIRLLYLQKAAASFSALKKILSHLYCIQL